MAGGALLIGLALLGTSGAVGWSSGRLGALERHAATNDRVKNIRKFWDMVEEHMNFNRELEDKIYKQLQANYEKDFRHPLRGIELTPEEKYAMLVGRYGHHPLCYTEGEIPATVARREMYYMLNSYMMHHGYDSYLYIHYRVDYNGLMRWIVNNSYWNADLPRDSLMHPTELYKYSWEDAERVLWLQWDREYYDYHYHGKRTPVGLREWKLETLFPSYDQLRENRRIAYENLLREREEAKANAIAEAEAKKKERHEELMRKSAVYRFFHNC